MMDPLKIAVKAILEDTNREWSIQGLGMLRTYLPDNSRLHIWNPDLKYADVSEFHTHPWDMTSFVVSGRVQNTIYLDNPSSRPNFMRQQILCGEGGGLEGEPEERELTVDVVNSRIVPAGRSYQQAFDQVHRSDPVPGTVTIIRRTVPFGGSPDHAYVYYPVGEEWISAEPRTATPTEIQSSIELALKGL